MTYRPVIGPVIPPPPVMETPQDWREWYRRYVSDQTGFRDAVRKWSGSVVEQLDETPWSFDEGDAATVYVVGDLALDEGDAT